MSCQFESTKTSGAYKCKACGYTARNVRLLPIVRACPFDGRVAAVGKLLAQVLSELGIVVPCDSCADTSAMMDRLGMDWCREHLDDLCSEIYANAKKWGLGKNLVTLAAAAAKATQLGIAIDPLHPIRSLVLEAIRRAEAAQNATAETT